MHRVLQLLPGTDLQLQIANKVSKPPLPRLRISGTLACASNFTPQCNGVPSISKENNPLILQHIYLAFHSGDLRPIHQHLPTSRVPVSRVSLSCLPIPFFLPVHPPPPFLLSKFILHFLQIYVPWSLKPATKQENGSCISIGPSLVPLTLKTPKSKKGSRNYFSSSSGWKMGGGGYKKKVLQRIFPNEDRLFVCACVFNVYEKRRYDGCIGIGARLVFVLQQGPNGEINGDKNNWDKKNPIIFGETKKVAPFPGSKAVSVQY